MTTQEIILDTLRMADLSREYLARAEAAEVHCAALEIQVRMIIQEWELNNDWHVLDICRQLRAILAELKKEK